MLHRRHCSTTLSSPVGLAVARLVPQMKILIASTPATGHLNPLPAIGHFLITEGHQGAFLSGSVFRDRILAIGSSFHAFPAGADFDPSVPASVASELESITPGADWLRVAMERMFVDAVPAQHQGLQKVLQNFPADVVIGDDMLFGVLPMLLGPDAKRPPIVLCGTSFLHWCRGDGAPHFIGLPPAITQAQRDEYAQIYQDHDSQIYRPVADRLNRHLEKIGVEPLSMTLRCGFRSIRPGIPIPSRPGFRCDLAQGTEADA